MFDSQFVKAICLGFAGLALFVGTAFGQPKAIGNDFRFTSSPPPISLSWQLATPAGEHVDLIINGIQPSPGGQPFAYIVNAENASQYGVDFPAWTNAVNDPAYSRSIMTFAGVIQELPLERNSPIQLDDIRVFIDQYRWPVPGGFSPNVYIKALAIDFPVVPEPSTTTLITVLAISLSIRPTNRFRRYTNRSRR
jgi:hypothetical protein